MAKIERFEDLECWKVARLLTKHVYILAETESLKSDFSTVRQLKSASLSTMNNIAEGFARFNKKDFMRFLDYAQSSASEVKSMTYVIEDLEIISENEIRQLRRECEDVQKLTLGLIRYLNKQLKDINTTTP
ncbi:MAG: four helix bundle protein [Bacteroidetes bacterium]|nr:four helix bundle protein [Bacteroidota bacterium]|tara:strand:- start:155 stop:547 length:393 start_codon:yes stop_codon:yes gene_type:complete